MGLDAMELVMEVEEAFDIKIDDRDAEKITTVGDLYQYVCARLPFRESQVCLSSAAFYHLRRTLMHHLGIERHELRPASPTEALLPERGRREAWDHLSEWLGWRLPPLQRPRLMEASLFFLFAWFPILALLVGWSFGLRNDRLMMNLLLSLVASIPLTLICARLTRSFATRIPSHFLDVRGLVEVALPMNYGVIGQQAGWSRPEVLIALRRLISEQLGVPFDEVTEDKSFVNDLGLD